MARRHEHTQEQIKEMALKAIEQLLDELPADKLSVRKIASIINYTPGTLYTLFQHQNDMLLQVNGRTLDRLYQQLTDSGSQNDQSPEKAISTLAKCYLQFAATEPNHWALVFTHKMSNDESVPEWHQQKINRLFELVEDQLAQLSPNKSTEAIKLTARTLWGSVHGITSLALGDKLFISNTTSAEYMLEQLIHYFLTGLTS
ncbi:TetR/AcrR family transcriptional regulator [Endozoicomonas sp. SM1973]|uniref:TetR/AcrR family transcriptional regulator n=1 Tax=Spartinivicinus marinus TaxID=2994442 RepID=A0A853I391_9GAMM|nr:TetR-like C-terminal domain-containing protein [Spartinivicinus marinus]MCX4025963.1 TetR-like C-terminal domain-containing protein [Spartinivicinus marinus]NYZ67863.1 TetR/AcrR family transcriptional regulator [Spartinivicinus marinus]